MMKPYIEYLHSIDYDNEKNELPVDPSDCWVVVQANIGVEGEEGSDIFTFYVCTIKWLAHSLLPEGGKWGRHILLVEEFGWGVVENMLNQILGGIAGETWVEVAAKIHEFAEWEFYNYQDSPLMPRENV